MEKNGIEHILRGMDELRAVHRFEAKTTREGGEEEVGGVRGEEEDGGVRGEEEGCGG